METDARSSSAQREVPFHSLDQHPPRGSTPQRPIAKPKRKSRKPLSSSNRGAEEDEEAGPLRDFATGDPKYDSGAQCCGLSRVGNFMVVYERHSRNYDGERTLVLLLGPYWTTVTFFTLPALLAASAVASSLIAAPAARVGYWALTLWAVGWLVATATRDPGIVRHFATPPPGRESTWMFSTQARSYRPPGSLYSRDANCVIEGFDHTCPWTGTAIGKGNTGPFHVFVYSVYALLGADLALCVHAALPDLSFGVLLAALGAAAAATVVGCWCFGRALVTPQRDTRHKPYGAVPPPPEITLV